MSWNFLKKKTATTEQSKEKIEKLPRPKDIPEPVGRCLVVDLGKDPDWVWQLKSVVRAQAEKNCYDVRIFDESQVGLKGIRVKDYTTFDQHPELILFEGWYDKRSNKAKMQEPQLPTPKAA
ncbi:MAG: hypothetical protein ACOC6B_03595 [Thermodesulfobacteriota bacterium]